MAKEFYDWNKKFSAEQIEQARYTYLTEPQNYRHDRIENVVRWSHGYNSSYSVKQIRAAVYDADDAHEWQVVRVAMKGLTTQQKLYMLENYYEAGMNGKLNCIFDVCMKRVHNYIGALRRGGQLDAEFCIRK